MLETLKKKYEALTEDKSPTIYLGIACGVAAALGGRILLNNYKATLGAASMLADLIGDGFHDIDAGDHVIRATLIKK